MWKAPPLTWKPPVDPLRARSAEKDHGLATNPQNPQCWGFATGQWGEDNISLVLCPCHSRPWSKGSQARSSPPCFRSQPWLPKQAIWAEPKHSRICVIHPGTSKHKSNYIDKCCCGLGIIWDHCPQEPPCKVLSMYICVCVTPGLEIIWVSKPRRLPKPSLTNPFITEDKCIELWIRPVRRGAIEQHCDFAWDVVLTTSSKG